jgi:hypothetical protein
MLWGAEGVTQAIECLSSKYQSPEFKPHLVVKGSSESTFYSKYEVSFALEN